MKKGLLLLPLIAMTSALLGACGGNGGKGTATQIQILHYNGGVGKEWLERSIERFKEAKKDESYESGKKGVDIKVSHTKLVDTSSMKGQAKNIYITEDTGFPQDLAANGSLLNINDWVMETNTDGKTIDSKIDDTMKTVLKYGGEYYALPHYELYPGATYDYELFTKRNLFFADPSLDDSQVFPYELNGKTYKFVRNANTKKACGNDGQFGTDDDGLPTSLEEFVVLTQYMAGRNVSPILFPGNHQDYSALMMEGMLASLNGKEGMSSFYTFNGEINVVTGYQNDVDYIVPGSGCPTPIVEKVQLTEAEGYKTRMTEERYAVICMMQILENYNNKHAFDRDVTYEIGNTNEVVQKLFLAGTRDGGNTKDYGILCEGNYWMNEAQGRFDDFYRDHPEYNKETNPRDVRWMSLPTKITGTVNPDEGQTPCLMDTGNSFFLVNKYAFNRVSEGCQRAIKEFVQFLYTDAELEDFTRTTGCCKSGVNCEFYKDDVYANLTPYQKTVLNLKKKYGVAYAGSTAKTYLAKRDDLYFSINAPIWHPGTYKSCIEAIRANRFDAKGCFVETQISPELWASNYYVQ